MIQNPQDPSTASPGRTPARHRSRSLATVGLAAVTALALAVTLSARLWSIAPGSTALLTRVDQVVELGVLGAGALVAWWLAAGLAAAAACAVARARGGRWSAGERLVARHAPAIARRLLALTVGTGVGLVAAMAPAGAQATDPFADLGWVATRVVAVDAGASAAPSPVTSPPTGPVTGAASTPGPVPAEPSPGGRERVTVRPGDSLWRIAADHLPAGAPAAEVAAEWPRWYETNRDVVGADPHLIRPGQVLTVPAAPVVPGAGS